MCKHFEVHDTCVRIASYDSPVQSGRSSKNHYCSHLIEEGTWKPRRVTCPRQRYAASKSSSPTPATPLVTRHICLCYCPGPAPLSARDRRPFCCERNFLLLYSLELSLNLTLFLVLLATLLPINFSDVTSAEPPGSGAALPLREPTLPHHPSPPFS